MMTNKQNDEFNNLLHEIETIQNCLDKEINRMLCHDLVKHFCRFVGEITEGNAPSTEREVWIDNLIMYSNPIGYEHSPVKCPYCFADNINSYNVLFFCRIDCAWFRIQNGLAMCGDKVIGKLIEKEETK